MHTNNEKVKNWHDESDKRLYEEHLSVIYEFMDINRVGELIGVIDSFVGNKEFEKFFNNCEFGDDAEFDFDLKLIPFIQAAYDTMHLFDYIPLYFPTITHKLIVARNIISLMSVFQLSFIHYNNRFLTQKDDKIIKTSNMFYYLTFFVEDYDNPDNEFVEYDYEYYKSYFKKLKKLYWKNKNVKRLAYAIAQLRLTIIGMCDLSYEVLNIVEYASIYLMACNAMKFGRGAINCEDVVIGYLTCYKLIFNDVRPLVYSLYDDEKWGEVNRNLSEYKYLDKSPFDNLKNND